MEDLEYRRGLYIGVIREMSNSLLVDLRNIIETNNITDENDIIVKLKNRIYYIYQNIYSKELAEDIDELKKLLGEIRLAHILLK